MAPASTQPVMVPPEDAYNRTLVANVHPGHWTNPRPAGRYNLVVLGAGTAGLVTAAGAAGLGARVALVERHLLGGDCLNVGCVPSKCVIRSSRLVHAIGAAREQGISAPAGIEVVFEAIMERMRRLRSEISHHDSAERFRSLGVDVFLGEARFSGPETVQVGDQTLRFKKAVIATGARAARPEVEGLEEAGYLTNETVFSLTRRPGHLAVLGGGPIGCELSQAFRRLGSEVTVIEMGGRFLAREDRDASEILARVFREEGVDVRLNTRLKRVTSTDGRKRLHLLRDGVESTLDVDEILAGVGRVPNLEGLNLEEAGVEYGKPGVVVNDFLQTTNKRIFAAGDICMKWKFTHAADAAARIVIQNALFLGRKRLSAITMPWCTYTDPEIAHVGLYEHDAREKGLEVDHFLRPLKEVDRGRIDGEEGFVKILVKRGTDRILGATIVASHAGEMISEVSLAIAAGVGLGQISNVIHPYPTQAEAIRQAADAYNRTRLTPLVKRLFNRWLAWSR